MPFPLDNIEELPHHADFITELSTLTPTMLNAFPTPILIKDEMGQFIFINTAFENVFETKNEKIIGKTIMQLDKIQIADRTRYYNEDICNIRNSSSKYHEFTFTRADGTMIKCMYWSCGFYNKNLNMRGLVGLVIDITRKEQTKKSLCKQIEELTNIHGKIEDLATRDTLTGLKHRRGFNDYFKSMFKNEGENLTFCLMLLDIDFFKKINDSFGYEAGDETLKKFVKVLLDICRDNDSAFRWGGEEFLVILPNTPLEGAKRVAERLRYSLKETPILEVGLKITVSGGIVKYSPDESIELLISRADKALYQAKANGRDRFCT